MSYLQQSSYYSYLIKVGSGLSEGACVGFALFNLCLLDCQNLRETLLRNTQFTLKVIVHVLPNELFKFVRGVHVSQLA